MQKRLPGQWCTQDVGTSVIVTQWSLQRCKKANEASLPCWYRHHLFNCGHVLFHRIYAAAGGRNIFIRDGIWPGGTDNGPSAGDIALPGTFLVLAVTVHMLHDIMGL